MKITTKTSALFKKAYTSLTGSRANSKTEKEVEYVLHDMRAKVFFGVVFVILGVLLYYTLQPYLSAVLLAILVAALIHPLYRRMHNKLGWSPRIITSIIILILALIAFVLIFFIGRSLISQATNLSGSINDYISSGQTAELQAKLQGIFKTSGAESIDTGSLINSTLQQLSGQLANFASSLIKNSFAFIVSITVFLASLVLLIPRMSQIKKMAVDISPLGPKITTDYIEKTRLLLRGAVVGSFIISLVASTIMGITFWLLGIPNALLFAVLAFFLGFIPYLGTTIFTFGAAIIFALTGNYQTAAVLVLVQLIILNQLDLVFRPITMPRKVRIHPALMIIAVMAGLATFGMIGIIFGPVILVLFMSSVQIYQQNYGTNEKPELSTK